MTDVRDGRIVLTQENGSVLYDVAGLDNVAAVSVVSGNGQPGLEYRTVGSGMLTVEEPFQWGRGTIAVVGAKGVLAQIDTSKRKDFLAEDPNGQLSLRDPYTWFRPLPLVAAVIVGGFLLLLLRARHVRRRRQENSQG